MKFKYKEKGQAFSTFQLLIAAVVALALLGVLMPIIGGINPGTDRLVDALKERINTQQNQPGNLTLTDDIKVSGRSDPFVSSSAITEGTGIAEGQVRFFINGYENDFGVSGNGDVLQIRSQSSVTYQFGVICNRNLNTLDDSINSYMNMTAPPIREYNLNDFQFEDDDIRVCLVFPVRR